MPGHASEVQLRLDGELIVTYQGRALLSQDAATGTTSLRAQNRPQRNGNQDTARRHGAHRRLASTSKTSPRPPLAKVLQITYQDKITEQLGVTY